MYIWNSILGFQWAPNEVGPVVVIGFVGLRLVHLMDCDLCRFIAASRVYFSMQRRRVSEIISRVKLPLDQVNLHIMLNLLARTRDVLWSMNRIYWKLILSLNWNDLKLIRRSNSTRGAISCCHTAVDFRIIRHTFLLQSLYGLEQQTDDNQMIAILLVSTFHKSIWRFIEKYNEILIH